MNRICTKGGECDQRKSCKGKGFASCLLFLIFLTPFSRVLYAHEGEPHTQPEIAALPLPGEGMETESATSETFEIVLKHPPIELGQELPLTIYLSDYETSEPVIATAISAKVSGAENLDLRISSTPVTGVYKTVANFNKRGIYKINFSVESEEYEDMLVLTIDLNNPHAKTVRRFPLKITLIAFTVLVLLGAGGVLLKRKGLLKMPKMPKRGEKS